MFFLTNLYSLFFMLYFMNSNLAIKNIGNKIKCINCRSLAHNNPELAKEWHPIKNGVHNPMVIGSGSQKKVWWKCSACNYEWEAYINLRITDVLLP